MTVSIVIKNNLVRRTSCPDIIKIFDQKNFLSNSGNNFINAVAWLYRVGPVGGTIGVCVGGGGGAIFPEEALDSFSLHALIMFYFGVIIFSGGAQVSGGGHVPPCATIPKFHAIDRIQHTWLLFLRGVIMSSNFQRSLFLFNVTWIQKRVTSFANITNNVPSLLLDK